MGKPLSPDLIMMRSKCDRLDMVKNLNLWGNDISDVSVLSSLPNLEILSLSVNKIQSLNDFQYCPRLSELYLRKNLITDLSEVQYLKNLRGLKVLWLWDNPCSESQNYRQYVIQQLPQLEKLDNQNVSPEERSGDYVSAPAVARSYSPEPVQEVYSPQKQRAPVQHSPPRQRGSQIQDSPPQQRGAPVQRSPPPQRGNPVQRSPPQQRQPVQDEMVYSPPRQRDNYSHEPSPRDFYKDALPRAEAPPQRQLRRANTAATPTPSDSKSENILCAILSLMKELDAGGLELIKREAEKKLRG